MKADILFDINRSLSINLLYKPPQPKVCRVFCCCPLAKHILVMVLGSVNIYEESIECSLGCAENYKIMILDKWIMVWYVSGIENQKPKIRFSDCHVV